VIYNPTKQSVDAYKKNELHKRGLELLRLSAIIVGSAEPNEAETNICMVIRYTGNPTYLLCRQNNFPLLENRSDKETNVKKGEKNLFCKIDFVYRRNASQDWKDYCQCQSKNQS
jgi:hypothetical protein